MPTYPRFVPNETALANINDYTGLVDFMRYAPSNADYYIYLKGSTWKAVSLDNTYADQSGADLATVLNAAMTARTAVGGNFFIRYSNPATPIDLKDTLEIPITHYVDWNFYGVNRHSTIIRAHADLGLNPMIRCSRTSWTSPQDGSKIRLFNLQLNPNQIASKIVDLPYCNFDFACLLINTHVAPTTGVVMGRIGGSAGPGTKSLIYDVELTGYNSGHTNTLFDIWVDDFVFEGINIITGSTSSLFYFPGGDFGTFGNLKVFVGAGSTVANIISMTGKKLHINYLGVNQATGAAATITNVFKATSSVGKITVGQYYSGVANTNLYYDATTQGITTIYHSHANKHASGESDAFASTDILEATVKRIQEETPTTLTVAGIADGLFLKRSGTTIIGATPGGTGATYKPTTRYKMYKSGSYFIVYDNVAGSIVVNTTSFQTYCAGITSILSTAGSTGASFSLDRYQFTGASTTGIIIPCGCPASFIGEDQNASWIANTTLAKPTFKIADGDWPAHVSVTFKNMTIGANNTNGTGIESILTNTNDGAHLILRDIVFHDCWKGLVIYNPMDPCDISNVECIFSGSTPADGAAGIEIVSNRFATPYNVYTGNLSMYNIHMQTGSATTNSIAGIRLIADGEGADCQLNLISVFGYGFIGYDAGNVNSVGIDIQCNDVSSRVMECNFYIDYIENAGKCISLSAPYSGCAISDINVYGGYCSAKPNDTSYFWKATGNVGHCTWTNARLSSGGTLGINESGRSGANNTLNFPDIFYNLHIISSSSPAIVPSSVPTATRFVNCTSRDDADSIFLNKACMVNGYTFKAGVPTALNYLPGDIVEDTTNKKIYVRSLAGTGSMREIGSYT